MIRTFLLVLLTLFVSEELFSQNKIGRKKRTEEITTKSNEQSSSTANRLSRPAKKRGPQNKVIAFMREGSIYIGDYINEDDAQVSLQLVTEDSISIDRRLAREIYTPKNALIFKRAKFHPTTGMYMHFDWGTNFNADGGGVQTSIGLGYRLNKKWEMLGGLGISTQTVGIGFRTETIVGAPLYVGGLYNLTDTKARIFAFSRLGPVFGIEPGGDGADVGFMIDAGLGINFASATFSRIQLTISNYNQYAKLDILQNDRFGNPISGMATVWLNRLAIRIAYTLF